jgi:hypothetical protein
MNSSIVKRSAVWFVLLCGMAVGVRAGTVEPGDFGAGIIIGDPTGLSAKWWLSENHAIDMALAWDLSGNDDRLEAHADYLWHFPLHIPEMRGRLPLYMGVGGRLLTGHDAHAGVRVPFGICYLFPQVPVELFAEITPLLDLTPDTDFSVNGGVGARFYFK